MSNQESDDAFARKNLSEAKFYPAMLTYHPQHVRKVQRSIPSSFIGLLNQNTLPHLLPQAKRQEMRTLRPF